MNKKSRLLFGLIVALVCALILAGCSGGSKNLTEGKSAKQIAEEAYSKLNAATNYDMDFTMQSSMMVMDQKMDMDMKGTGTVFTNPIKMKMVMDINANEPSTGTVEKITMEQYIITEDDSFVVYQKQDDQWFKMTVDEPELTQMMQMSPTDNLKLFMDNLKEATIVADETVNGVKTVKINLVASGNIFDELLGEMDSMGLGSQMSGLTQDILKNLGDLSFTIWVDKTTLELVKSAMDLSPVMKNLSAVIAENIPDTETMTDEEIAMMQSMFESMTMYMEYTVKNADKAKDFSLPAEAANAQDLGDYMQP